MSAPPELEQSIQRHEGFLRVDPGNSLLLLNLGELYHKAGRFDQALDAFERAQGSPDHRSAARSRAALVHISAHRFAQAEALLQQLLHEEGENAALLYNLGLAQSYQERWESACASLSRAIALGVQTADAYRYLTHTLHHLGRMPEALEACNAWLAQAQNAASRGYLALLEMDGDNMARAQALAGEVLADEPDEPNASVVMATWCIEQHEMDQAQRLFEGLTQRQPDNPRGWLGLGLAELYQGRHSESIAALGRAVQLMPENGGTIVALGWAHLANRDAKSAERTFEQAVRAHHTFGEAHGGLASALAMQGRVQPAEREIRIAQGLDRGGFGAQFAASILLQLRGNQDAATRLMTRILEQRPRPDSATLIEHLRAYGSHQLRKLPPSKDAR